VSSVFRNFGCSVIDLTLSDCVTHYFLLAHWLKILGLEEKIKHHINYWEFNQSFLFSM